MAKKKKAKVGNLFNLVAIVFAVVALCMLFVDAIKVDLLLGTATYTGTQITFGYATDYITYFSFSILNLLPYLLVLCSTIVLILRLTKTLKAKYWDWIAVIMFAVSAVLFFLAPSLVVSELYDGTQKALAIGGILSAVFSICAGVVVVAKLYRK